LEIRATRDASSVFASRRTEFSKNWFDFVDSCSSVALGSIGSAHAVPTTAPITIGRSCLTDNQVIDVGQKQ
jgi:hypothetical protein